MKYILSLVILFISQMSLAQQNDFEGSYMGLFSYGNFQSDLSLDIQKTNDEYEIKFNSLDQNAFGIPARDIIIHEDSIEFALQSDFYRYEFRGISLNNNILPMTLVVDGKFFEFQLHKGLKEDSNGVKSKDVRFRSENLLLYGTIYYPVKPNGKAIYLVTSSGNNDRSASRAEALMFAQNGFITLHTDKRGTGISDGNWQKADMPTLCNDDILAIQYLSQIEKLTLNHIGIKGSSQGAAKVPYIMSKLPELMFGIAVSCPGSTLLESDLNYWKNRHKTIITSQHLDLATNMQKAVFQYISGDLSKAELEVAIAANKNETWFEYIWIPAPEEVETDLKLNYSPLPFFELVKQPLLVLQGSMDQVIPPSSLKTIKKSIHSKKRSKNKYLMLKGADHSMMFKGESDFPYWSALHPDYTNTMLKWIGKL
jgi:cephalosporin-C deacetylase-like acetyl esterase